MTFEEIDALVAEAKASFAECDEFVAQASAEEIAEDLAAGGPIICPACSFDKRLVAAIEWLRERDADCLTRE